MTVPATRRAIDMTESTAEDYQPTSLEDLEAFIREELCSHELDGSGIITISHNQVGHIAASIARRAIIGR